MDSTFRYRFLYRLWIDLYLDMIQRCLSIALKCSQPISYPTLKAPYKMLRKVLHMCFFSDVVKVVSILIYFSEHGDRMQRYQNGLPIAILLFPKAILLFPTAILYVPSGYFHFKIPVPVISEQVCIQKIWCL